MKIKNIRLILFTFIIVTSLLLSGTAYAQEEELPSPGITPDSPFYFMDTWGKGIGLFLAFGPEAKVRKALEYAGERLAEAQDMAGKNKIKDVERAAAGYDEFLAIVSQRAEEARQQGVTDNISERVALATAKHLSVLDRVKDKVPEEAREAIAHAREVSLNGQKNALRALAREKPERAVEISLTTIKDRLERASIQATENITGEVGEAVGDTEELLELGEEISKIARERGKDTTAIEELLAAATSNHLEVLARVYEKVPEQARPAIERAMGNAVRNHERLVEALKEKGALGKIPEEAPIPERVREKVKEQLKTRVKTEAETPENEIEKTEDGKEAAAKAIEEAQEELAEIRARAARMGISLPADSLARFDNLLSEAKLALAAENYREVKRLAVEAEATLKDIKEAIEKLNKENEGKEETLKKAEQELRELKVKTEAETTANET